MEAKESEAWGMLRIVFDLRDASLNERAFAEHLSAEAAKIAVKDIVIDIRWQNGTPNIQAAVLSTQNLKIDRIDFVAVGTRCHSCNRMLTSGSAYIVRAGIDEHPYGPTCVGKKIPDYRKQQYPDFTRASNTQLAEGETKRAKKNTINESTTIEEEYLRLRYEKLSVFAIPGFEPLNAVYERYKESETLSNDDQRFVSNFLNRRHSSSTHRELSHENLQACYAYDHWLGVAVAYLPEEKRGYLLNIQKNLRENLYLTAGQIAGANKWLSRIENMPELDAAPFAWVVAKKAS